MLAWIIVIVVLLLILIFPVGIDAAYGGDERFLKLKLGPFRKTILPPEKNKPKKKKKKKDEKPEQEEAEPEEKQKKKRRITLDDVLTLAEIGLDALHRFRVHLSIDRFRLYWTASASDPYSAVLQYGRVNAALGALTAKAHGALKVRDEEIRTTLDLEAERPEIRVRLIMSIQIWEILLIGLCAGAAGLRWILKKKRNERAAAAAAKERSIQDGEL